MLDWGYIYEFALFATMGAGANFVLPTALAQQIPYLEHHTPEGLCIATYMNISTACSILFTLTYLGLKNRGIIDIPFSTSVPSLLTVGFLTSFLAAGVYTVVVWKISLLLFICCTVSGAVGSLSAVIFNPFITRYKNNYISATRVGGSSGQLLAAVLAAVQQPGSSKMTMSPSVYLAIFGILLFFPLVAYRIITKNLIGLKGRNSSSSADVEEGQQLKQAAKNSSSSTGGSGADVSASATVGAIFTASGSGGDSAIALTTLNDQKTAAATAASSTSTNPMTHSNSSTNSSNNNNNNGRGSNDNDDNDSSSSMSAGLSSGEGEHMKPLYYWKSSTVIAHWWHETVIDGIVIRFLDRHTQLVRDNKDWLPRVIPLMFTIAWVNFNTWGMLSALMPFAVHFATMPNVTISETEKLSIAYQVAALCLVVGDYSTTKIKLPIDLCVMLFTVLVFIIYFCASDVVPNSFQAPGAAGFIVAIYCISRLIEAHVVTTLYRTVATEIAVKDRENAAQAVGTADQVSTVTGAIISTILVSTVSSCS